MRAETSNARTLVCVRGFLRFFLTTHHKENKKRAGLSDERLEDDRAGEVKRRLEGDWLCGRRHGREELCEELRVELLAGVEQRERERVRVRFEELREQRGRYAAGAQPRRAVAEPRDELRAARVERELVEQRRATLVDAEQSGDRGVAAATAGFEELGRDLRRDN